MARTESTQTYNKTVAGELEVIPVFKELMKEASGKDSMYIHAKESLLAYFAQEDCILSEREKSEMLVNLIGTLATSTTSQAMTTAVAIAKENRDSDHVVTKMIEETRLIQEQADKVAAENLNLGEMKLKIQEEIDLLQTQDSELQLSGTADRLIKAEQALNEADKRSSTAKAREVQEAQRRLYERQILGFDDNRQIKAFESQLNSWALLHSSGMIDNVTVPDVISSANLTSTYNGLVADTDESTL